MMLEKGQIIANRYEVMEEIGRGGMSIVYRAKDIKLGRDITLKILREEFITDEDFLERFQTEAKAVAALSHPNIVNVYDVGVDGDVNFIVMEYVDGLTLKQLIRRSAPFVDESILGVTIQIADALSHAHKHGIVHRDIKPQNILITKNGDVKVTDFGIARMISDQTIVANNSKTMGSVQYLSPEQAKGEHVDERSDLYSLGIVMFEMATGTLPFSGDTPVSVAYKQIKEDLPSIASLNPHIHPILIKIIEKLTRKEPFGRYQSADDLSHDIKLLLKRLKSDTKKAYQESISHTMDISHLSGELASLDEEPEEKGILKNAKPEKLAILAGLGLALVIGLVAVIIFVPKLFSDKQNYVEIPDVINLSFEEAKEALETVGLKIEELDPVFSETIEEGNVAKINYKPGSLPVGETVGVHLSLGKEEYKVPDLLRMTDEEARNIVSELSEEKGFMIELVASAENSEDYPKGVIMDQNPKAGTMNKSTDSIEIVVSKGPEIMKVSVPSLMGLTEAKAKELVLSSGLQVGQVYTEHNDRYKAGLVCGQTIAQGSEVNENTVIGITVSLGEKEEEPVESEEPEESDLPTEATPQKTTRTITVNPVVDPDVESYTIKVAKDVGGSYVEVYEGVHKPTDFPIAVEVEGEGVVEFVLLVDGVSRGIETIDFDN